MTSVRSVEQSSYGEGLCMKEKNSPRAYEMRRKNEKRKWET